MFYLKIQILIAKNAKKQFALSMALQNQYERASNETSRRVLTIFPLGKDTFYHPDSISRDKAREEQG
jgi:hypothetical protein